MARINHRMLRALIDSSTDSTSPSGAWHRKQVEAAKEQLRHTVKMMKQVFKGRAMPTVVAAFVEDCDKHLGSQQ